MKSNILEAKEESIDKLDYFTKNTEMIDSLALWHERLDSCKSQRNGNYTEFDDNTYMDDYYSAMQDRNSYLRQKLNDDEVRINTSKVLFPRGRPPAL